MKDTKTGVVLIIKNKKGEYLMITRTEYKSHKGEWGPVAGHIKEGETPKRAIIREAKEELGVEVKPIKRIAKTPLDLPGMTGLWYECKIIKGEIDTNHEISRIKYISAEDLKTKNLWPATRKFFEKYVWK